MNKKKLNQYRDRLTELAHTLENEAGTIDVWYARDIQKALDYTKWQNFQKVVAKAAEACENASQSVSDHFTEVSKTIQMPKGATREIQDILLTRYACYLIAQNADPSKEVVAFAQSYFAVQTRLNELNEKELSERVEADLRLKARDRLKESEKELSRAIHERGLPDASFARIRSQGDAALFGRSTGEMKKKLQVPKGRPLADFLHRVLISGKAFAADLTSLSIETDNLATEQAITFEHVKNNTDVRKMLIERGVYPENLPPQEDIKKLERRLKKLDKKALEELNKLIESGKKE